MNIHENVMTWFLCMWIQGLLPMNDFVDYDEPWEAVTGTESAK